ncbi:MAG TPA: Lrp/AsnC family transcriptional regulator [Chromobacteriaceae bacterium]|nr:Lrp/AsnC family transcriptional regulator [Chromobacteriaceae bacterium]
MAAEGIWQADALDTRIIEQLQGGFPLQPKPFAVAAAGLQTTESILLHRLAELLKQGVLTRFGPMYQIERMGGRFVLAALMVPEERFDEVAAAVNALPVVAHNYRREHAFNMWFVLATATAAGIGEACAAIEAATGLPVHAFPKEREYFVGMHFAVGGQARVGNLERSALPAATGPALNLEEADHQLVRATQAGLPLVSDPWQALAQRLDMTPSQVVNRLRRMLDCGVIRRIGAVPNHYRIGYRANGMAVFDVADDQVDRLGQLIGQLDVVSHCYRRPRHLPHWPYNLFAMLHGPDRASVLAQLEPVKALLGDACSASDVLFSTQILKKSGLRI